MKKKTNIKVVLSILLILVILAGCGYKIRDTEYEQTVKSKENVMLLSEEGEPIAEDSSKEEGEPLAEDNSKEEGDMVDEDLPPDLETSKEEGALDIEVEKDSDSIKEEQEKAAQGETGSPSAGTFGVTTTYYLDDDGKIYTDAAGTTPAAATVDIGRGSSTITFAPVTNFTGGVYTTQSISFTNTDATSKITIINNSTLAVEVNLSAGIIISPDNKFTDINFTGTVANLTVGVSGDFAAYPAGLSSANKIILLGNANISTSVGEVDLAGKTLTLSGAGTATVISAGNVTLDATATINPLIVNSNGITIDASAVAAFSVTGTAANVTIIGAATTTITNTLTTGTVKITDSAILNGGKFNVSDATGVILSGAVTLVGTPPAGAIDLNGQTLTLPPPAPAPANPFKVKGTGTVQAGSANDSYNVQNIGNDVVTLGTGNAETTGTFTVGAAPTAPTAIKLIGATTITTAPTPAPTINLNGKVLTLSTNTPFKVTGAGTVQASSATGSYNVQNIGTDTDVVTLGKGKAETTGTFTVGAAAEIKLIGATTISKSTATPIDVNGNELKLTSGVKYNIKNSDTTDGTVVLTNNSYILNFLAGVGDIEVNAAAVTSTKTIKLTSADLGGKKVEVTGLKDDVEVTIANALTASNISLSTTDSPIIVLPSDLTAFDISGTPTTLTAGVNSLPEAQIILNSDVILTGYTDGDITLTGNISQKKHTLTAMTGGEYNVVGDGTFVSGTDTEFYEVTHQNGGNLTVDTGGTLTSTGTTTVNLNPTPPPTPPPPPTTTLTLKGLNDAIIIASPTSAGLILDDFEGKLDLSGVDTKDLAYIATNRNELKLAAATTTINIPNIFSTNPIFTILINNGITDVLVGSNNPPTGYEAITDLTIKSVAGGSHTISDETLDFSGMTSLKTLTLGEAGNGGLAGDVKISVPPSTGTRVTNDTTARSPFVELNVNSTATLESLTLLAGGDATGIATDEFVLPDFETLTITGDASKLTTLTLNGLGIEKPLTIDGTAWDYLGKTINLQGNGLKDLIFTDVKDIKTLDLTGTVSTYNAYGKPELVNGVITPKPHGGGITLDSNHFTGGNETVENIIVDGATAVSKVNLNSLSAQLYENTTITGGHDGLVVDISNNYLDGTTTTTKDVKFTITGPMRDLISDNNMLTSWSGGQGKATNGDVVVDLTTPPTSTSISTLLQIHNNAVMDSTFDFSHSSTKGTKTIDLKTKIDSKEPNINLGAGTVTLKFDDKGNETGATKTEILTIRGGNVHATDELATLELGANTKASTKEIKFDKISFHSKELPTLTNGWTNDANDKKLTLSGSDTTSNAGNNITLMGQFYGYYEGTKQYLEHKGYSKTIKIIDLGENEIIHLNLTDQTTLDTLDLNASKDKLITFNIKGLDKLIYHTTQGTIGDALTGVFSFKDSPNLTKVDYSGCTQLGTTATPNLGTDGTEALILSNNILDTVLLQNITGLRDVKLDNNKLTEAHAGRTHIDTDTPPKTNQEDINHLLLGEADKTNFHSGADAFLDISDNPLKLVDFAHSKITEASDNEGSMLNLVHIYIEHTAGNTIINGVYITGEPRLKTLSLGGNTVGVINGLPDKPKSGLYLGNNLELAYLYGTLNHNTSVTLSPSPPHRQTSIYPDKLLHVKGYLSLANSPKLYGLTAAGDRFIDFNHVANSNEHNITNADLSKTKTSSVMFNNNIYLDKLILLDPVDDIDNEVIDNIEVKNNNIKTLTAEDASNIVLPKDKTKISGRIVIDHNPIQRVFLSEYNELTFISINNLLYEGNAVAKPTPPEYSSRFSGLLTHKIGTDGLSDSVPTAIELKNNKKLAAIDISGNEIHKLVLSTNEALHSIYGTLSVDIAKPVPIPTTTATTAVVVTTNTKEKETALIVGVLDLSELKVLPADVIFRGHLIKKAYLQGSAFESVDLRRNNAKNETNAEVSPEYMKDLTLLKDAKTALSDHGILEYVNISDMKGNLKYVHLDENKLKTLDNTGKTPAADLSVDINNTTFLKEAYITLNKNDFETVRIVENANTKEIEEIQINDNLLINLDFTDLKKLKKLYVNRTLEGKNEFTNGEVILKGAVLLEEFAPATIVNNDKIIDANINRMKPVRPDEHRWNIKKSYTNDGVNFILSFTPKESIDSMITPKAGSDKFTPKIDGGFVVAEENTGFYNFVPLSHLDVSGATKLKSLRVPGNHLTNGTMSLASTPAMEILDISGTHELSKVPASNGDFEYLFPGTNRNQDYYFYKDGSASESGLSAGTYKDPLSGRVGVGKSFVPNGEWSKLQHVWIYNNQYTGFSTGSASGSLKTVLAHNNKITSVDVARSSSLQVLDVERNMISPTITLPTANLLIFRAGHNMISVYPNTKEIAKLQEIYLNHNNFPVDSKIETITPNQDLRVLNVAVNNFITLPDLHLNAKLKELYAYSNKIEHLRKMHPNGNLQVVDLHHNLMNYINELLPDSLRYLDISDNDFIDFTLPNLPKAMAGGSELDPDTITAHEVRPSHNEDQSPEITNRSRTYKIGTLNIRHNMIAFIPNNYHTAWQAYFTGNSGAIKMFYLEYNILPIDVYDPFNRDTLTGTQKWLTSERKSFEYFLTATMAERQRDVVPHLRLYHPGRKTMQTPPKTHVYEILCEYEVENDKNIFNNKKDILMNAESIFFATIIGYRDGSASTASTDMSHTATRNSRMTPDNYKDEIDKAIKEYYSDRRNSGRNMTAILDVKLWGPDVAYADFEGATGETDKTAGKEKDINSKTGKYNPTTGPKD